MNVAAGLPRGYRLVALDRVDGTNAEAKRRARDGAPAGTVFWAREQLAGRGRDGRSWASPPGNLYVSLLLRPQRPAAEAAQLGFIAALALGEALRASAPGLPEIRYKWPNDVLASGRKIAGILLESQSDAGGGVDWLVAGMGVNVAWHPDGTEFPATSVARETGAACAVEALLVAVVTAFETWYGRWLGGGTAPALAAWRSAAFGIGAPIRVRLPRETLRGTFADIDPTGALVLDMGAAGRRKIAAGEVFFGT